MKGVIRGRYPRIFLDIELYRPRTGRGRAGFFSDKTRLVAVSLGVVGGRGDSPRIESRAGRDEAELIRWAYTRVERYSRDRGVLAGYNILSLDIPFILLRAGKVAPDIAGRLTTVLLRRFLVVDMYQIALIAYEGEGLPGMASFYSALRAARGLDPVQPKGSGYRVHEWYESGRLDLIREYSRREMEDLVDAFRLLYEPGPVYPGRVPGEWRRITSILPRGRE